MERCPHCKAPIYGDLPWTLEYNQLIHKDSGLTLLLGRWEPQIMTKFLSKYPAPVLLTSIIYDIWAAQGREEPDTADKVIATVISRLRKLLKPAGMNIVRRGQGMFALEKYHG